MKKICICGGGNIAHVAAGFMAARGLFEVSILTRRPECWKESVTIYRPHSEQPLTGRLAQVSSKPEDVVTDADFVLLCLPGYAIRDTLLQIRPCLRHDDMTGTAVGSVVSSTGFFLHAAELLPADVPLFGLQRVPFIARTKEYGRSAALLGYKASLAVAVEHTGRTEELRLAVEQMFSTPTRLLNNFYEASLSNSNPLLHPARLYDLWHDWHEGIIYKREPMFYEEWTEAAAKTYIALDGELQQLLEILPVAKHSIPTVLDYYESCDAASLAAKLRSIAAFKGIKAPMKAVSGGYVPDFGSRYFIEDFQYGLGIIRRLAAEKGIATPVMDYIFTWGEQCVKAIHE